MSSCSSLARVSQNSTMDHQWRPMPPPYQANICPICSVSHFPFCPPPPPPPPYPFPYNQNPRFPNHPDYPQPDTYPNGTPSYGFNYCREGFKHQQHPHVYDYSNGGEVALDRRFKRPRVDEIPSGVIGHDSNQNSMISLDNERRLKLIRDHGGSLTGNFSNVYMSSHHFDYSRNKEHGHGDHSLNQDRFNDPSMSAKGSQFLYMNNWQDHHQHNLHHYQNHQSYGFSDHVRPGYDRNDQGSYLALHENRVLGGHHQHPRLPPPPLPPSPPPPVPMEPPLQPSPPPPPPPPQQTSLFPVPISSSLTNPYLQNKPSTVFFSEEWQKPSVPKQLSPDKPTIIDASRLFRQPHRATRPDHIVIILRGLPGSGKSYLAKMMRDLEVENGCNAPRIHSMDDYFMTEVEKVEESDTSNSSSFVRSKKPTVKIVMEYCYEPEMEEAYRDSMLKAFKKTVEEGVFKLVIVDDRNLRVADFAQFWAIAKRSGYEVYISEATYKDPVGCAARNVHGFMLDEIKAMAWQWEEAPTLYLQLDLKSLFHGDDLKESGIQEVDMDAGDGTFDDDPSGLQERRAEKTTAPPLEDDAPQGGKEWDEEEDHLTGVKELLKSKWSDDLDEEDTEGSRGMEGNLNALSGLIQAYGKKGKSLQWSDQVGNTGFSIGTAKNTNKSLVIGPGAGYNLKSNPLSEEGSPTSTLGIGESRRQSIFQERLRAEKESFKAVFDRRKRRIGRVDLEEE